MPNRPLVLDTTTGVTKQHLTNDTLLVGAGIDTATSGTLTIGSTNTSAITIAKDTTINGNLTVNGTTTSIDSTNVLVQDNHLYLNDGYNTVAAQSGGLVVNYFPTATNSSVASGPTSYVAGVAGTSNPTVTTNASAVFAAGDIVQIAGSTNNDGLYEVLSHVSTTLTLRGVGLTACVEDFTQSQVTAGAGVGEVVRKVSVSVMRASTSGDWQMAKGSATPLTFTNVGTGTVTSVGLSPGSTGLTISSSSTNPITTSGTFTIAGTLAIANGGTGAGTKTDAFDALAPTTTAGDTIFYNGTDNVRLAIGAANTVLRSTGSAPAWGSVALATDVSGTLPATNGGTGQSSYAVGDLLYADTTTSLAKLADDATGSALISGGINTAPSWGKIGLTTHVTGTLPVLNGGTGANSLPANALLVGNGTATVQTIAAGSAGDVLESTGTGWASTTPNGNLIQLTAAETINNTFLVTQTTAGGVKCDATVSTGRHRPSGFAFSNATTGQVFRVRTQGYITLTTSLFDGTAPVPGDTGKLIYMSGTTQGFVTLTPPTSAGDVVQSVGLLLSVIGSTVLVLVQIGTGVELT